ncbi:unannotated protein [freshwater metagenome]|uniref:Unannotated protein n=1 Tax=freshwater metagenome TaxID=449393 RepID=A0A6J7XWJ8_9ZZZZ|nr:hypothetical protein [Actinomycetota bacterium]
MSQPRVLCIGDVMLDVVVKIQGEIHFGSDTPSKISTHGGGAAGNVASWITCCNVGAEIVARVGDDPAGLAITTEFDALGVTYNNLVVKGYPTGVVVVLVDKDGERTMFPETGANSGLQVRDMPILEDFVAAYISGYALLDPRSRPGVLEMIKVIRNHTLPIFFDPCTIGAMNDVELSIIRSWLPLMDAIFPNEEEALYISESSNLEDAMSRLLEWTPMVIVKRGAQGAAGIIRGSGAIFVPAVPVAVVDTTGAGDSFAAGFIAQHVKGGDLASSLQSGALSAAQCVANIGARPQVGHAL